MLRELAGAYREIADDPVGTVKREPFALVLILGPFIVAGIIWGITVAVKNDMRQGELIRSGACDAVREALYTPSGYMQCMVYNKDGTCMVQQWVQPASYMRTLWQCPDETFWRASGR
jgi:hypothetical protein